jgi:hypothetical protein
MSELYPNPLYPNPAPGSSPGNPMRQPLPFENARGSPQTARQMSRVGSLGIAVIVCAVAWTAGLWTFTLWVSAGVAGSSTNSNGWLTIFVVIWLFWMMAILVTYVLTGIWLWRARRNADLIAPDRQGRPSKAWVWLGWIVPFANFVFPGRVLEDVWRATVRNHEAVLKWWWASWCAWLVLGVLCNVIGGGSTRPDIDGRTVAGFWLLTVGTTIALPLWIRVVRTLSQTQDALASGAAASGDFRW